LLSELVYVSAFSNFKQEQHSDNTRQLLCTVNYNAYSTHLADSDFKTAMSTVAQSNVTTHLT